MGVFGQSINTKDPFFGRLSDDQLILSQAAVLMLSTQKGTYRKDPDYGHDLMQYVCAALTAAQIGFIQTDIPTQLTRDRRIKSATCTVDQVLIAPQAYALYVTISITPADGPSFDVNATATAAGVALVAMGG